MKRCLCLLLLFGALAGRAFALSETFVTVGYENDSLFEFYADSDIYEYMNSSGVNINISRYWNGYNIGLFVQQSFLFPTFYEVKNYPIARYASAKDYDNMFKYGIVIGPSFRFPLNDKFFLNLGAGPGFSFHAGKFGLKWGREDQSTFYRYLFGLGVNFNASYNISDILYAGLGAAFNFPLIIKERFEYPDEE